MRTKLLILVIVLQVIVLGYMAGEREWVLHKGTLIHLQTAPLDPRDPFRGNYVRLDYGVGRVPTNQVKGTLAAGGGKIARGTQVYAVLRNTDGGIASLDYLTGERPDKGLFLRGRVDRHWGGPLVPVRYGLEAYFMQADKAKELEGQRWRGGAIQVPLEMEVAVAGNGVSVLKGYRWCALGIGLKLDTVSATNRQVRAVTVQLVNVSSNDLAIVSSPGGQSLTLTEDWLRSWGNQEWSWVMRDRPRPRVTDEDVVVLKPGQQHDVHIDFTAPEWFVKKAGEPPKSLRDLPQWGAMFRLVYRPPTVEECRHLKHASILWHGELPSRAFGGGRVD